MGPKERRIREREEVRTLILDAARELFANEGYEAVTMRRIADKIEYSATAIYFHFKDKETLLNDLCQQDFYTLAQEFMAIAETPDPIARLRATGQAYVRFAMNYPNHYRLMFMTPHPAVKHAEDLVQPGNPQSDAYAFLLQILRDAIDQGRIRPDLHDLELLGQTIWAGVHGVASLHIAKCNDGWVDWRTIEARTDAMIDVLLSGVTAGVTAKGR